MIYLELKIQKLHKKSPERKTFAPKAVFLPQVNSLSRRDR